MTDLREAVVRFEALLSSQGQELLGWLRQQGVPSGTALGVAAELRTAAELRARYPVDLVVDALAQHELRLRAQPKFGRAADMFFTRAGLEQASAEPVARHRARRYAGITRMADLCCGIGGDLVALAAGRQVLAVDRDPLHLRMAMANAEVYGVAGNVSAVHDDVRNVDLGGMQAVFIDPARRAGRRRLRTGDSEPPLSWCLSLAGRIGRVGIKAAPGLAHEIVPQGWEMEFVAVGRELKEAIAWSPALATATRRATILPAGHTLVSAQGRPPETRRLAAGNPDAGNPGARSPEAGRVAAGNLEAGRVAAGNLEAGRVAAGNPEAAGNLEAGRMAAGNLEAGPVQVRPPGEFLFDPNPAVTRAGLVQELALMIGAWKIDEQIAFLSTDAAVPYTPFARALRVIDSAPWNQKRLPERLRALDIGAVDIRRRGLAGDVDQLHRQLRLSGSRRATLVMTRVADRPWGLLCLDVDQPE